VDKPRDIKAQKLRNRILVIAVVILAIGGVTYGLTKLKPASPTVDGGTLYPDSVKRGEMLIQVRGLGTLVPEDTLLVPTIADGRIAERLMLPGTPVKKDSIIFIMSNPELELSAADAAAAVAAAEADLASLRARLQASVLDQRSTAANVQANFEQAKVQHEVDMQLEKEGLTPSLTEKQSRVKADGLETQFKIEKERVAVNEDSMKAQIDAQISRIDQLKAQVQIKKQQVESLKIRAGADGVLQQLLVEVGQKVPAGTALAKVVQPQKLKAELKIAETQANVIRIGQIAEIDTRNGIIMGKVERIDPSSINSTVTVDVKLEGALPDGARPDLSVDGTVTIERLTNVLNVARPVHGQANSTITLFKYEPSGDEAVRTVVKLGRTSVNTVEILGGLKEGDKVILSDMSAQDGVERIRIK
jgi:HlyD family secretion protein